MKVLGHCRRCHSALYSKRTAARGYGDRCWRQERQERAARAAGFSDAAIGKARELIEDGGILPIRRTRHGYAFAVAVAEDITRTYRTAPQACTCPAGLASRACYHRAAAVMLAA